MSDDLYEWLSGGHPPFVARLDGPGATGVLERLSAADPGFLSEHSADRSPPAGRWIWLHEAGIATDVVVELAALEQAGRVVLTGPAKGAGAPRPHFHASYEGAPGSGWTRLHASARYATREEADARLDAFSAHLLAPRPDAELQRLVDLGRYDEAERYAFQEEPLAPKALLLLARANEARGRVGRARQLLVAARRRGSSHDDQALLDWYQASLLGQPSTPPPGIHQHRVWFDRWRGGPTPLQHQATDVAEALLAIGPLRTPLRSKEGAAALLRLGWFGFARRLHPLPTDPEPTHRTLLAAWDALAADDVAAARRQLDAEPDLARTLGPWGTLWIAYRAVCAAREGDGPRVHRLTRRLLGRPALPAQTLQPLLDRLHAAPAWERIRLATTIQDWTEGTCGSEPARARFEEPPVVGHYQLDAPIGQGGMGRVWRATFVPTGRPVAVKTLRSQKARHIQLFLSEVDIATRLDHPAIVSVLDHGLVHPLEAAHRPDVLSSNQPYLVMERVEGGSLSDHVGRLAWPEIKAVLLALLDALAYAHSRGVVHRDLKPSNVLIGRDRTIRLCDFGLAGLQPGRIAGTPMYMAPEQFAAGAVDGRADLYAVGALTWALACGLPPRMGSFEAIRAAFAQPLPPFEPAGPVPAQLGAWIARLLESDPAARFDSAAQAAASLLELDEPSVQPGDTYSRWQAPATFVFESETLLGLESVGPLFDTSRPGGQRVKDLFRRDLPYRQRLPITSLLHRGDPPLQGRDRELGQLLEWMDEARTHGEPVFACLKGARGSGRSACLFAARRRLAMEGLFVSAEPTDGPALLDASSDPVERWMERARGKPWLVVWTRTRVVPDDARVLELGPLNPVDLFWIVRARLPVEPALALRIALRSVGNPQLALHVLQDLVDNPGVEASVLGLKLSNDRLPRLERTEAWWREELAQRDATWRAYAEVAALLGPQFRAPEFHATCRALGLSESRSVLPSLASPAAWWQVPPTLCRLVLEEMPLDRRRAVVAVASEAVREGPQGELRAAMLRLQVEDAALPALVAAVRAQFARARPLPLGCTGVLEAGLDAAGVPETDERRSLTRLEDAMAHQRAGNTESFDGLLARARASGWFAILAWAARIRVLASNQVAALGPMVRLAARTGNPYDRVTAMVVVTAVHHRNGLPWRRHCDRALERCRRLTPAFENSVRRSLSVYTGEIGLMDRELTDPADLAIQLHHCMRQEAYEEGWRLARDRVHELAELRSGVGLLNLAAMAIGVGATEEAGVLAVRGALGMAARGDRRLLNIAQILILGLGANWPSRQWEDLARVTQPTADLSIRPIIRRLALHLPPDHPRRRTLFALFEGETADSFADTTIFRGESGASPS